MGGPSSWLPQREWWGLLAIAIPMAALVVAIVSAPEATVASVGAALT